MKAANRECAYCHTQVPARNYNVHVRWHCMARAQERANEKSHKRAGPPLVAPHPNAPLSRNEVVPVPPQRTLGFDPVAMLEKLDASAIRQEIERLDNRKEALQVFLTAAEARDKKNTSPPPLPASE